MTLSLNPTQLALVLLLEHSIASLEHSEGTSRALKVDGMANAFRAARESLQKAHEAFVRETQRAVSVATPADMQRLVVAP